jgi:hypothetical protein
MEGPVLVEWFDSCGCSRDWEDLSNANGAAPMVCRSVGWVAERNSSCVVIVPHVCEATTQGCGDMTIPASAIISLVSLVPATKRTRKRS